jgi:membrane protein implicated in regulation of membrane protease activity
MDISTVWWLLAGILVALELATGTFYLLMLALGMAAGAVCAHLGLSNTSQLVAAAVVGALAAGVWYLTHPTPSKQKTAHNPDLHLDIGSTVNVDSWSATGATSVVHRGASWLARHSQQGLQSHALFETGPHRIVAVDGNTLVLSKI